MNKKEYKQGREYALKSDNKRGHFSGYASVFDYIDGQNDVILAGAFSKTLKKQKGKIKLLWQHKADIPIGEINLIQEDPYGLYIEGHVSRELRYGKEAYSLLKTHIINGLSIGYTVVDAEYDRKNNLRIITEVDLWEVSIVTFPANDRAVIKSVKALCNKNKKNKLPDAKHNNLIEALDAYIAMLDCK